MSKPFDYSKWDNIELSDDESDLHPNIDKDSWFRLKHRTRIEREEREDQEVREIQERNKVDTARVNMIEARLKAISSGDGDEDDDAQFEDTDALEIELKELKEVIKKRDIRVKEIQEKRQWNIDNICKVTEEKTIVNSVETKSLKASDDDIDLDTSPTAKVMNERSAAIAASNTSTANTAPDVPKNTSTTTAQPPMPPVQEKGAEPANSIKREKMAVISYNDYCLKHEKLLEKYSEIHDLDATKDFLFKHCDVLLHEHAQSYILLSCLEDEMNGKHTRMKLVCRQSQILSHIHELGVSMNRDPRDVILPFFKRIHEPEYLQGFLKAVQEFTGRIQKRAIEKRKEMDAERAEDEEQERQLGPGGLDPMEVFEQLPAAMREAFESQEIERLHQVLATMDPKEAKFWMKKCVDSGLWVAKDSSIFDDNDVEDVTDTTAAGTGVAAVKEDI